MSDLTKLAEPWPKRMWTTECVGYYGAHYWDVSQISRDDTSIPVLVFPADQAPEPCKGIPDPACDYLAACGQVCNKCGTVHRLRLLPNLAAELAEVKKKNKALNGAIKQFLQEIEEAETRAEKAEAALAARPTIVGVDLAEDVTKEIRAAERERIADAIDKMQGEYDREFGQVARLIAKRIRGAKE